MSHPLSGMLRRRSELSQWGLVSQKQCQIEQKAKHTEVLDVLATVCASREALSRITVEESHNLVALVIIWEGTTMDG